LKNLNTGFRYGLVSVSLLICVEKTQDHLNLILAKVQIAFLRYCYE